MLEGWPGETLLVKLVETFEKGVGATAKPWQILRDGKARTEARRREIVILAQAKNEAESIRAGQKSVDSMGRLTEISAPESDDSSDHASVALSNDLDVKNLVDAHHRDAIAKQLERSINLRRIAVFAQEEVEDHKEEPVSDEPVDKDWFSRWRNKAQDVSHEEMQRLWAKILAGEVQEPGTFSIHAIDFLSRMSKKDADLLGRLANLSLGKYVFSQAEKAFNELNISFENLIYLNDLGVLNGVVGIGGLSNGHSSQVAHDREGVRAVAIVYCTKALMFFTEKEDELIKVPAYTISSFGREILSIATREPLSVYIEEIAKHMKENGFFEAKIGTWVPDRNSDSGKVIDLIEFPIFDEL